MQPDRPAPQEDLFVAVAEDYARRRRSGVEPQPEDYREQYPEIADELRHLLPTLALLETAGQLARLDRPEATCPEHLGRYRIECEIGRGGQAVVYRAVDERLDRRVALKVLAGFPGGLDPARQRRFEREAQAAADLDHPGLCAVYEAGVADGCAYIAMRYIEGDSLAERIAQARETAGGHVGVAGTLDREIGDDLRLTEQVARALAAAHDRGLVHRDVKPSNILVTPTGDPVLVDFGLIQDPAAESLTGTGDVVGTPAYLAPEQISSDHERPVDARTDVYALGVTLYELLTLERPFRHSNREQLYQSILRDEPENPRHLRPRLSRDVAVILATCLRKNPAGRYRTALDLAEDLRRARQYEPILARPAGPWIRLKRWTRRNRLLATAFALVLGGLGVSLVLLERESVSRIRARAIGLAHASAVAAARGQTLSLLLAQEAVAEAELPETVSQLRGSLASAYERQIFEYEGWVYAVQFSPDSDMLLTGCADGLVRIHDVETGTLVHELDHEDGIVISASYSPDGRKVLTASGTGIGGMGQPGSTARVWDLVTGESCLLNHGSPLSRPLMLPRGLACGRLAVFSHDGQHVLTGGQDGVARLWDAEGTLLGELRHSPASATEGEAALSEVSFSPDDRRVLTAALDGTIKLWRVDQAHGEIATPYAAVTAASPGHAVLSASFSPDPDTPIIISGSSDGALRRWTWDGRPLGEPCLHPGPVFMATFAPDGSRIATASVHSVFLWNRDGSKESTFLDLGSRVWSVEFSADRSRLAVASHDGTVRVFRVSGGEETVFRGHAGTAVSAVFSPDGRLVASAGGDHTARVWSEEVAGFPVLEHAFAVRRGCFLADGRVLTAARSGVKLWSKNSLSLDQDLEGQVLVWRIAIPTSNRILTGSQDAQIGIWTDAGEPIQMQRVGRPVFDLAVASSCDPPLVLACEGTLMTLYEFVDDSLVPVRAFDGHDEFVHAADLTPDGKYAVSASEDCTARLWQVDTAALVVPPIRHTNTVSAVRFLPDGSGFVTAGDDPEVRFFDLRGRRKPVSIVHDGAVRSLDFSPDGNRILTASMDGTARVSDLHGKQLVELPVGAICWSATFSPDGMAVLTTSSDRTARLWPLEIGELRRLAQEASIRTLTPRERLRYLAREHW